MFKLCNLLNDKILASMSSRKAIADALLEMFPHLKASQAESLAATGDDLSVLVTRVLDDNVEAPSVELKEIVRSSRGVCSYEREYNYPEVFQPLYKDLCASVQELRAQASKLYREADRNTGEAIGHRMKCTRSHYSIEADDLRARAGDLNKRAAMLIMRQSLEKSGPVDLHGLYVNEAILFIEDLFRFYNFKTVTFATGRKYNSPKLRPAVEEWLTKHGFMVSDEGPCILATARKR